MTANMLVRIEKQLGRPVVEFFDYIIGNEAGGLISIALGVLKFSSLKTQEMLTDIYSKQNRSHFGHLDLSALVLNNPSFRSILQSKLGEKHLFSHSNPKVAVTSCSIEDGNEVVFTSYNHTTTETTPKLELRGTLVDAALATLAGTNLVHLTDCGGPYIAGSNPNPCKTGYHEAQAIWPESKCDLVLSLGTGIWEVDRKDTDVTKKIQLNQRSLENFQELQRDLGKRCYRVNPNLLRTSYNYKHAEILSEEASKIPDATIKSVCSRIIASNFYLVPETCRAKEFAAKIESRTNLMNIILNNPVRFSVKVLCDGKKVDDVRIDHQDLNIKVSALPTARPLEIQIKCKAFDEWHRISGGNYVLN